MLSEKGYNVSVPLISGFKFFFPNMGNASPKNADRKATHPFIFSFLLLTCIDTTCEKKERESTEQTKANSNCREDEARLSEDRHSKNSSAGEASKSKHFGDAVKRTTDA